MKKFIIIAMMLIVCCSCAKEEEKKNEEVTINSIECEKINDKLSDNGYLIDVRSEQEFSLGSLDGAINVPVDQFEKDIEKVVKNKDANIIVFCQSGTRSKKAAEILKKLGYKNIYDLGSIENCK